MFEKELCEGCGKVYIPPTDYLIVILGITLIIALVIKYYDDLIQIFKKKSTKETVLELFAKNEVVYCYYDNVISVVEKSLDNSSYIVSPLFCNKDFFYIKTEREFEKIVILSEIDVRSIVIERLKNITSQLEFRKIKIDNLYISKKVVIRDYWFGIFEIQSTFDDNNNNVMFTTDELLLTLSLNEILKLIDRLKKYVG